MCSKSCSVVMTCYVLSCLGDTLVSVGGYPSLALVGGYPSLVLAGEVLKSCSAWGYPSLVLLWGYPCPGVPHSQGLGYPYIGPGTRDHGKNLGLGYHTWNVLIIDFSDATTIQGNSHLPVMHR